MAEDYFFGSEGSSLFNREIEDFHGLTPRRHYSNLRGLEIAIVKSRLLTEFSKEFISNIQDVHGDKGIEWLRTLPARVAELEHDWNFSVTKVMPNLTYSYVARVKTKLGGPAVLKLAPCGLRCNFEIAWYEANQVGAPRVIQSDKGRGAILMEDLVPGYSVKKLVQDGDDAAATRAIAQAIKALKPSSKFPQGFKHVSQLSADLDCLQGKVNPKLIDQAKSLFKELTRDSSADILLHGDIHHDNVLSAGNRWVVIDPHGYVGPAAFEIGTLFRNPYDCFPTGQSLKKMLESRLRILKEELPFSFYEIQGWAIAYTMMATGWSVVDHGEVPKIHIEIVDALNEIKIHDN